MAASRWFPNATTNTVMMYSLVAAYAGFIAPSYFVDHYFNKRQRALRNAFPDALDLMVVCVEAGLGLTQAIQRVSEELGVSHPELSAELGLVNAEIGVGVLNLNVEAAVTDVAKTDADSVDVTANDSLAAVVAAVFTARVTDNA